MASSQASEEELRFGVQQLCEKLQSDPDAAARLNGKEIEVGGIVKSIHHVNEVSTSIVLIDLQAPGAIVTCNIDPTALTSKTMLPTVKAGTYARVLGSCEGSAESVKLAGTHVVFVKAIRVRKEGSK